MEKIAQKVWEERKSAYLCSPFEKELLEYSFI